MIMNMNEQEKAMYLDNLLSPYCHYDFSDMSENAKKVSCSLDAFAKESEYPEAVEFFTELLKDKKEKIVTYSLVMWYMNIKKYNKN
jgi:hypothetical protein